MIAETLALIRLYFIREKSHYYNSQHALLQQAEAPAAGAWRQAHEKKESAAFAFKLKCVALEIKLILCFFQTDNAEI